MQDATRGRLQRVGLKPDGVSELRKVDLTDLASECAYRFADAQALSDSEIQIGDMLGQHLNTQLDVYMNRFAPEYYQTHFWTHFGRPQGLRPIEGASVLDVGCGGHNPAGMSFLMLLCGARFAAAIDGEPPHDVARAARALPDLAQQMLVDPRRILRGHTEISRVQLLERLEGFDLAKLAAGEIDGAVPGDRLQYHVCRAESLPFEDGAFDISMSTSFLEHVEDPDVIAAELARVTAKGGFGLHVVDGVDHRSYADSSVHSLEFLKVSTDEPMVGGENRLRRRQLGEAFERHGFDCSEHHVLHRIEVDEALRNRFAEPFRSMELDELSTSCWFQVMRRL